jgi:response regulator RpfG family c-di-GMP phosphodiesterase
MDGAGYPDGLSGADIPLAAQIVFVADAFANAGSQFASHVVAALEALSHEEPELLGDDEQPASRVA